MAVNLTDQVHAVSKRFFIPKMTDTIYVGTPELRRLKEKGLKLIDGGTSIIQPLEYAEGNFQWYTGAETLSTADVNQFQAAEYDWRQCAAPVVISRLDELRNMGDAQVVDFVKAKMKAAQKTLTQNLSEAIFNDGTVANQPVGLRAIVGTSSTIGGIAQNANSWWQGQVDSSTTTFGLPAIETNFLNCSEDNEAPTVAYTTKSIFGRFWGSLQPQQRFADEKSANAGFKSLMFNGIPVIAATNCPASHWFHINEEYFHLYVHKDENMKMDEFERPRNQNVKVAHVFWAGALGSSNNRYQGKLSALSA